MIWKNLILPDSCGRAFEPLMEIRGGVSGWDTQRANQEVWAEGMVLLCMWTILVHPLVFQKYVMNLNFAIKALKCRILKPITRQVEYSFASF